MKFIKYIFISLIMVHSAGITLLCAQKALPLEEAYQRATSVSKSAGFYAAVLQQAEADSKMGISYPFFNTLFEGGQINSALFDTKVTISQSGYFPGYHKAFKSIQSGKWELAKAEKQIADWEVKRIMASLYVYYSYYAKVTAIYSQQDSLYSRALDRAKERLQAGESDGIEVMEATAQVTHVRKMKTEALAELNGLISMFRLWVGGNAEEIPDLNSFNVQLWAAQSEEAIIGTHPLIDKMERGIQLASMEATWKRAQRMPMWTLALSNTSFRGTGADDKKYDAGSRFTSFQLGIGLPVFGRQTQKTEEIIKMSAQRAFAEKEMTEAKLNNAVTVQKQRLRLLQEQNADFEKQSLPLANQLLTIAKSKLDTGEIDFMKYAYMTGQAYALMLDHASLNKQLGEAGLDYYFINP